MLSALISYCGIYPVRRLRLMEVYAGNRRELDSVNYTDRMILVSMRLFQLLLSIQFIGLYRLLIALIAASVENIELNQLLINHLYSLEIYSSMEILLISQTLLIF